MNEELPEINFKVNLHRKDEIFASSNWTPDRNAVIEVVDIMNGKRSFDIRASCHDTEPGAKVIISKNGNKLIEIPGLGNHKIGLLIYEVNVNRCKYLNASIESTVASELARRKYDEQSTTKGKVKS